MKIDKEKFKLIPVSQCKITKLSETDEYVYDMEVEDNSHTFFSNDILVHNSLYVRMDNILKKLFNTTDVDWYDPDVFAKIKNYIDNNFQEKLNNHIADFICEKFHTSERRIEFKREKISRVGDYLCKKRYAVQCLDNEGVPCDKFAYVGVDIAKNELPQKIKDLLKELVENMMKYKWVGPDKIQPELQKIYNLYSTLDINDVAFIKNLSTQKQSQGFLGSEKGAGVHARAANIYNDLIEKFNLKSKYELINEGDRFHYMYILKSNKYNIDCVAWKDRYPDEFKKLFEIDVNKMFQKTIVSPLKKFLENHKCNEFDPESSMIEGEISIFDL